jgi:hypothetical protein
MKKFAPPAVIVLWTICYVLLATTSSAQTTPAVGVDYAPGEVILTFKSEYMPTASEVTAAPPAFGVTALDSIVQAVQGRALLKLIPTYGALATELGQRMERRFLLRYSASDDPMDVVEALLTKPYFETVTVNTLWWFELSGTYRVAPGDTTRFPEGGTPNSRHSAATLRLISAHSRIMNLRRASRESRASRFIPKPPSEYTLV